MHFCFIRKSPRRHLVVIQTGKSFASGGHSIQFLEPICETDYPVMVSWLLEGIDDERIPVFACQLLEAAAVAKQGEPILSKNVPKDLYADRGPQSPIRGIWEELKRAINKYPTNAMPDPEDTNSLNNAFKTFLSARKEHCL